MKIKNIRKTLIAGACTIMLCGCDASQGVIGRVDVELNGDSTIKITEQVAVPSADASMGTDAYHRLYPSTLSTSNITPETTVDTDSNYTLIKTETSAMTLAEYATYVNDVASSANNDYWFLPSVTIENDGLFKKTATISYSGFTQALKNVSDTSGSDQPYSLDSSDIQVAIAVPGEILECNATDVDEETRIATWKNNDIDDIKIVTSYIDFSGVTTVLMAALAIVSAISISLFITERFTRPKPSETNY